ncbi:podoplanin isoform X2 [Cynoglossus semilaevis]|uniref:podoplanin isoform X2 n=1 Tax=Cynoglossus semilaevis TaxID=244447 RepID=UPI000495DAC9|nr:uncharacterized protein LOC103384936 isoform X2 [Cynoglossus semilaevis]
MNVQLLLLVALLGSFCGFTHASPTVLPDVSSVVSNTIVDAELTTPNNKQQTELTIITGPTSDPPAAPEEVTTETLPLTVASFIITTPFPDSETAGVTSAVTDAAELITTGPPVEQTTAPAEVLLEATSVAELQPEGTAAPEVQTGATVAPEVQPQATAVYEQEDGVVMEDGTNGSLSSGQVVGIVIGALLAVVIVIVVVITVVRRMRKYTL